MAEASQLTGPDLRVGIPLSDLVEGSPLAGHADGEAVLLLRRGAEVFAVGGTCTHYGGPLIEGVVRGNEIRCPWHHACFSLRSGEALAAPALNPLPRWRTEMVDGVVRVTEREAGDVVARPRPAAGPASVVIIGAGAAGSAAAEMLRREGYAGRIALVDPDPEAPYDRPNLSKDYLAGSAPEEWLPLRSGAYYAEHGIDRLLAGARHIDADARRVALTDGSVLEYGALLLATGASPIRPELPGAGLPHVHVLRSLADCRHLIRAAGAARRVVIAGASFIGLEAAAALRARGLEVCVVAPEAVPFARVLGEELGKMLRALHEQHGIAFRLGRTLSTITSTDVVLDDGTTLPADVVLLGVGVRPLLDLAQSAGVADARGVPVNAFLETRRPGIWAAGDIAQYPDPRTGDPVRVEHWVVAQRQGQAVARNLLGRGEPFTAPPFFWTQQHGVTVNYVGHAPDWDAVQVEGDVAGHDCRVSYLRGDVVLTVATVGRDRASLEAELALERAAAAAGGEGVTGHAG